MMLFFVYLYPTKNKNYKYINDSDHNLISTNNVNIKVLVNKLKIDF